MIKKATLSTLTLITLLTLTACQDNSPTMTDTPLEQPLDIIIEPKRVAMTGTWAAGIKEDGTLWTWGTDGLNRMENPTGQTPTPWQVQGIHDAVAVSGGGWSYATTT